MTRIRGLLIALYLALAIPVAILVLRALDGIEYEREARHVAVTERIFDEMERGLSDFLRSEEARPIGSYRFYLDSSSEPGGSVPADAPRSPLSRPSEFDFVIGHFEVDAEGRASTPLSPDETQRKSARARGDWPLSPEATARVTALEQSVAPFWRQAARRADKKEALRNAALGDLREEALAPSAPGPLFESEQRGPLADSGSGSGSGNTLDSNSIPERRPKAAAKDAGRKQTKEADSYSLLSRLNQAGEERKKRKPVVTQQRRDEARSRAQSSDPVPAPSATAPSKSRAVEKGGASGSSQQMQALAEPEGGGSESTGAFAEADAYESEYEALEDADADPGMLGLDATQEVVTRDFVEVVLDPMSGRAIGPDRLMLYRTVLIDDVGLRQGVLIDSARLGDWLSRDVYERLGDSSALSIQFATLPTGEIATEPGTHRFDTAGFHAAHAFAPPFQALHARVDLGVLEEASGAGPIHALAVLLALAGALGLFAVDRMTGVVVAFAERRSNFVAAVTHELKTPLTAIRMYAEMLRDGLVPDEDKRHEYHRTITLESERLSRLIDNVLEFSRLEKGTRAFDLREGDLTPTVREIVEALRSHAEQAGFVLTLETEEAPTGGGAQALPSVRFDRDALVQILFNLVDNALKYAREAERREVLISLHPLPADSPGVRLTVSDFGPGVAKGHLRTIFEPFFREEAELTRSTKGSGIGLALVRELAEAMGAKLHSENRTEGGLCVALEFAASPAPPAS